MSNPRQKKEIPQECKAHLIDLISDLKEKECLAELKKLHSEGFDASKLLGCSIEGVRSVGLRFEEGEYYISALIMAGEIMSQSSNYLKPFLSQEKTIETNGTFVLGTIEGDIHDLGKNIFKDLLECNGFDVTDLGVDVPPGIFVEKTLELDPDFVGISCLLTTCLPTLHQAVKLLKQERVSQKYSIIIGGTCVDQIVNDHIKADHWFVDAIQGVMFCRNEINSEQSS